MAKQKEYQENQGNQQQQKSSVDRANDLINKGQSVRNKYKKAQNLYRAVKLARTAAMATQGVGALASTSIIWLPFLIVIILFILIFVIIIFTIFGSNPPVNCASITASSNTASASTPVMITADDCTPNVTFSWSSESIGGIFNPTNTQSTTYTPPSLSTATPVIITVTVCSTTNASSCTELTIELTITNPTCTNLGGICMSSGLCNAEGMGTYAGGLADCRQDGSSNVCCKLGTTGSFVFHCQGARKWNQTSCRLGNSGCVPTATSMILNTFGDPLTPLQVANQLFNGDGCNGPTNIANYLNTIRNRGFVIPGNIITYSASYGGYAFNLKTAKYYLDNGYLLFAGSGPFLCLSTSSCAAGTGAHIAGHAFVIQAVDPANNTITIRDPNACSYSAWDDVERPRYNTRALSFYYFGNFHHVFPIKKR